jgi:AraC-like DNA-binding protein
LVVGVEDVQGTAAILNNILETRKRVYRAAYQEAINEFKQSKSLSMEESFLAKLNGLIDKHMANENFNVEQLSSEMYMSRTQIHRKLRTITNMSTTQYIKHYKLERALKELKAHTGTVSEIAYRYGFSSPAYFSRVFQEIYGLKPSEIMETKGK